MGALRSLEGQSIVIEELATHYTIGDSVVGLPSSSPSHPSLYFTSIKQSLQMIPYQIHAIMARLQNSSADITVQKFLTLHARCHHHCFPRNDPACLCI